MLQHAELDIDERAAAPVTLEAFNDLVEWYLDGDEERPGMSPPLCLGWDIHNKFGADGFAIWRDLMFAYEPPLLAVELLVPRHNDYDWLILSQFRMGRSFGATRIWMLRATPG
jgi:hypothetical protein